MLLTLLATSVFLAFLFVRSRYVIKQLNDKITAQQFEIKKINTSEKKITQELKYLQEKLHNAIEDSTTHLLGWELFEDRLNQTLLESERYQLTAAILFVDVKDFKIMNEALGYDLGNEILREVAKRLQDCIRQVDSVSRYTKDVFVILLTRLNKPEAAAIVVQRILQSIAQVMPIKNHELYITVTVGAAIYPVDGSDAASLLQNADHALQSAKDNNYSYQFYHEKIHANSQREYSLSARLKNDNVCDEFVIYYRPILNMQKKNIFCIQALLYWNHPELGLIEPQELFTYIEKQGKHHFIAKWLIENACKQFLRWRGMGFQPELLSISMSINQLQSSQFIYQISKILQDCDFNPAWLLIEIKNTSLNFSFDVLDKAINMLNYLKVKLAIPDFGQGFFSIAQLKNTSVDYLVLNNALINDAYQNEHTKEFIKAMLKLAHSLSLQIIVEGVETQEQSEALSQLGCHLIQGDYVGLPLLEKDLIEKMMP